MGLENLNNDVPVSKEDENVVAFNPNEAEELAAQVEEDETVATAEADGEPEELDFSKAA